MKKKASPHPTTEPCANAAPAYQTFRKHVNYPAALGATVERRMEELESGSFSRYAVELVCFDLRIRRNHSFSAEYAHDPDWVQEAIDSYVASRYQPGTKRNGDAIRELLREARAAVPPAKPPRYAALVKEKRDVYFPLLHQEIIDIRWRELGYSGVSQYLTSLIRYDLMLGGPHKYFRGNDCTVEMLESLDRTTLAEFHANRQPKILADYILEEEAGQPLTREECDGLLKIAAQQMRQRAVGGR